MKKTLMAFAVLGACADAAQAQSSVTLYGIIDAGLTYTNNQAGATPNTGKSAWQLTSGNLANSRWGLKGSEDIGGGNSAVFTLENGFNVNNGTFGQGGQEFGRQAYVGLSNGTYGTLTLGRQYDSFSDLLGAYASSNDWATEFGSHLGDLDNLNEAIRLNNAVKYVSPTIGGFSADAVFSLGGHAGNFAQDRGWSLAASYATGPFSAAAGYLDIHNPLVVGPRLSGPYAPNGVYEGDFSSDYQNLQNASSLRAFGLGGSYTVGKATLNLVWTRVTFDDSAFLSGVTGTTSDIKFDTYEVNGKYALSDAWTAGLAYIYTDGKVDDPARRPKFHQVNLGTNYALSKRTTLYLVGVYQKAAGDGIVPLGNGSFGAFAETPGLADSGSSQQLSITAGIRHVF